MACFYIIIQDENDGVTTTCLNADESELSLEELKRSPAYFMAQKVRQMIEDMPSQDLVINNNGTVQ